jgi:hypothetical protein
MSARNGASVISTKKVKNMKTKLLLLCTAMLVITMITVPVMAAPPTTIPPVNPVNEILTIAKDIQIKVGTILANLTSVQKDVAEIKLTTSSIDQKLNAPSGPVIYHTAVVSIEPHTVVDWRCRNTDKNSVGTVDVNFYMYDNDLDDWSPLYSDNPVSLEHSAWEGKFMFTPDLIGDYQFEIEASSDAIICNVCYWVDSIGNEPFNDCYKPGDFYKEIK